MAAPSRTSAVLAAASAAVALAPLGAQAPAAAAASASLERGTLPHCVVDVADSGAGAKDAAPRCYATFAEVLRSVGHTGVPASASPATYPASALRTSSRIKVNLALHYWDYAGEGASILVTSDSTGHVCNGGTKVLYGSDQGIVATRHLACGTIKHYDGPRISGSCTGDLHQTQGASNEFRWIPEPIAADVACIAYHD